MKKTEIRDIFFPIENMDSGRYEIRANNSKVMETDFATFAEAFDVARMLNITRRESYVQGYQYALSFRSSVIHHEMGSA